MYEFHGWANIEVSEPGHGDWAETQDAVAALAARLKLAEEQIGGWFEVRETLNGQIVIVLHGLRNHCQEGPRELFR